MRDKNKHKKNELEHLVFLIAVFALLYFISFLEIKYLPPLQLISLH